LVFHESSYAPADQVPTPLSLPYAVPDSESYAEPFLVMLNTSTALSGRLVSTLNPRAIVLGENTLLAFNRGIQRVELISRDRGPERSLNFYLLHFEQACNAAPEGCSPGDLYTPRVESNWTAVRIEDDEDLKNTPADCRQCHQRGSDRAIRLMRELDGPWTHFFMPDDTDPEGIPEPSGFDVVHAYFEAKGDERYGNVPWVAIRSTFGSNLQFTVERPQPLVFDGGTIMNERWPWTKEKGFVDKPLPSPTWKRYYEGFKRGEHLAMPHYEPFPSDPDKLADLTDVYQRFRSGELSADELPDLSDVYPDDPQTRAEIGLQTEPGATPAETLIQACGACHNDVLDQTLSRARFNIGLARLSRAELDLAVARLQLAPDDPGHMPPLEARQLDPNALEPLVDYLRSDTRPAEDDAMLEHAATLGMAMELSSGPIGAVAP